MEYILLCLINDSYGSLLSDSLRFQIRVFQMRCNKVFHYRLLNRKPIPTLHQSMMMNQQKCVQRIYQRAQQQEEKKIIFQFMANHSMHLTEMLK